MGVPKAQAERNRQAIIEAASRVFRERGVDGVGVADVMKEAGFTHGGFYNHFASKNALAAECCEAAFDRAISDLRSVLESGPSEAFRDLLVSYLSCDHRDAAGAACPTAALAVDAARQGELMQAAYASGINGILAVLEDYLAARDGRFATVAQRREGAVALLATLVGSVVIARGIGAADPDLSKEVLMAGRSRLPE